MPVIWVYAAAFFLLQHFSVFLIAATRSTTDCLSSEKHPLPKVQFSNTEKSYLKYCHLWTKIQIPVKAHAIMLPLLLPHLVLEIQDRICVQNSIHSEEKTNQTKPNLELTIFLSSLTCLASCNHNGWI